MTLYVGWISHETLEAYGFPVACAAVYANEPTAEDRSEGRYYARTLPYGKLFEIEDGEFSSFDYVRDEMNKIGAANRIKMYKRNRLPVTGFCPSCETRNDLTTEKTGAFAECAPCRRAAPRLAAEALPPRRDTNPNPNENTWIYNP